MNNISIRTTKSEDNSRILELEKELGDFHKDLDDDEFWIPSSTRIKDCISNDNAIVLVAEDAETIVSYCLAIIESQPPEFNSKLYGAIKELMVTNSHRGHGIGEKMVKAIENWFRNKDIYRIEVGVAAPNKMGAVFWQKMGYNPGLVLRHKEI